MKNDFAYACAAAAFAAGLSLAAVPAAAEIGEVAAVEAVALLGTVVSVDQTTRDIILRAPDGRQFRVHAGEEVRNLPQVKDGDIVTLTYRAAMATELRKAADGAKPSVTVDDAVERARLGAKPSAENIKLVTIVGAIVALDPAANTLTIKGPLGELHTVKVEKDENKKVLATLKVGDLVEGAYAESMTLAVSAPPAN